MTAALFQTAGIALRILALSATLVAPIGALALKADDLGIGKQGAGLVLFVTLQRQAMS
ncbi:MAG: hypothetical protein QHC90_16465 [Shinella sp.]|nr:hypothetical protein [Shinella sp.]